MGASASIVDQEEWTTLLQQLDSSLRRKKELKNPVSPPAVTLTGTITRIAYAAFGVLLDDYDKVIYIVRFPPTDGTVVPLMDTPSSNFDREVDDNVSIEEVTEFWSSTEARQVNGLWKGGSWGLDNFMYHSIWCKEAFVGDKVRIDYVKNGVIKFQMNELFKDDQNIVARTDNNAWSCNITIVKKDTTYPCYVMNHLMPQYANDLLFIWNNKEKNKRYVKVCKRGNAPVVDMQNKYMPGAGEHLEPGEHFKFKESILRAFREELGVNDENLKECYLLDLGKFSDPARDPRYWNFFYKDKRFGMKRYSTTHGYVLYYQGTAPKLMEAVDNEEVIELGPNEKKWVNLDTIDVSTDAWMIEDHAKIIRKAKDNLPVFDALAEEEKHKYWFDINDRTTFQAYNCAL